VVGEVLEKAGLTNKDIDWLVPHQANKRIIDGTGRKLGLPPERVVGTVDKHANTSAASIPLALEVAVSDGRVKRGDLLLLEGIGGGVSWGASHVRSQQAPFDTKLFEQGENRRRFKHSRYLADIDRFPI